MIRHILFDLDCTLYSVHYGFEDNVGRLIQDFSSSWLNLSPEECKRQRSEGLKQYGTTLEWLTREKGFTDVTGYLEFVHPENEADTLLPDPQLRSFLENLPCPCSILTNSPGFHADRIVKKLGLEGIFVRIFDIETNGLRGKPHASAFRLALDTLGLKPEEALFVDDMKRYVEGYLALGGKGILFDERDIHTDYPHPRIKSLKELTQFLD